MQGGGRFFFVKTEDGFFLPEDEAFHAVKVLRKQVGDEVLVIDGKGKEFSAVIVELKGKKKPIARLEIKREVRREEPRDFVLKVMLPLLKGEKTEFLVEKGVELGVDSFVVYFSDHTVAKPKESLKRRLEKKIKEAVKQCGRLFLPEVTDIVELKGFLKGELKKKGKLWGCYGLPGGVNLFSEEVKGLLKDFKGSISREFFLVTGPEGGFSREEENLLEQVGFLKVSLGKNILKAETASFLLMGFFCQLFEFLENYT